MLHTSNHACHFSLYATKRTHFTCRLCAPLKARRLPAGHLQRDDAVRIDSFSTSAIDLADMRAAIDDLMLRVARIYVRARENFLCHFERKTIFFFSSKTLAAQLVVRTQLDCVLNHLLLIL